MVEVQVGGCAYPLASSSHLCCERLLCAEDGGGGGGGPPGGGGGWDCPLEPYASIWKLALFRSWPAGRSKRPLGITGMTFLCATQNAFQSMRFHRAQQAG